MYQTRNLLQRTWDQTNNGIRQFMINLKSYVPVEHIASQRPFRIVTRDVFKKPKGLGSNLYRNSLSILFEWLGSNIILIY